ncbi:fibrocystin [Lissotriton helveticus]
MSICSFADKQTKAIYPIKSDHGYGTLQCRVEGHFIGSHNVSFSVFNIGNAAVTKDAWLISAKQELFLYQTHPDILSVVPVNGSLGGGTNITISGDFFHHPSNVTIAGVPCETKIVSPTMIVCTTGPVKHHRLKSPQPGNRGLLFQVWNGTSKTNVTESSLGYSWGIAPNASSLPHLLPRGAEPFSSSLSGFFVAPETNNYTFWIQADDKATLYFCHSEDLGKKVMIASIPAGISSWFDHWEKNWNESWQQKSEKFELIGGRKYYMEAWHYGKMPSTGMKVGVQIHNTWLNPTVVNTYHREKLEVEVRAVRLPEIQMLTLTGAGWSILSWDNVSSCLIPFNATAQQIENAIEEILAIKCVSSSMSAAVLLRANFEKGLDAAGTEGQLAAWPEPYCGRFSSLKPRHLIKMRQSSAPRYDLTRYTHVCFAYKGYIKNAVNVSISYTNIMLNMMKKNLTCLWNHDDSNLESWTFGCTNLWINCVNSSGFPKDLRVNSTVWVHQIDLFPLQMEDETLDWFYVDEIIVSDSNHTVFQTDLKPARPGGSVIESVSVTGLWPTFNLSFWVANCVIDLPLIEVHITLMLELSCIDDAIILCSGVLTFGGSSQDGPHAEYAEYKNDDIKMTIRRLQSASPPVGGNVKIQLSDTILTGVPADISSSNLKRLLQSNADKFMAQYINASDFTVIKTVSTCYHSTWTITWMSTVGDLPFVIQVFNENLTGLYPTVTSRVIYDGGVFLAPIFGDMLATANELPQVAVHVNDIPATCSGSCSFQYLQAMTPTVTDINYSSDDGIRMQVYVTGSGFTYDSQAVAVQINQTVCKILQANSTRIVCSTSTLPPRGTYPVTVQVAPNGFAVNSSGENVCLKVEPRIFTINPSTGSDTVEKVEKSVLELCYCVWTKPWTRKEGSIVGVLPRSGRGGSLRSLPDLGAQEARGLNELEVSLKKLDLHYLPKTSTIMERYHFGKRAQKEGESIEDFVSELRRLPATCKFGGASEERIRDQFVLACRMERVREELWLKDDPPLREVLIIAKQVEHMLQCVSEIKQHTGEKRSEEKPSVSEVATECEAVSVVKGQKIVGREQKESKLGGQFKGTCYRCGKQGHLANDKVCPALRFTWNKCGKKGHFRQYCKSGQGFSRQSGDRTNLVCDEIVVQVNGSLIHGLNDTTCEELVVQVDEGQVCSPKDTIRVGGTELEALFDSCSRITIISAKEFSRVSKGKIILRKMDVRPGGYAGRPISMKGYFWNRIEYRDRTTVSKVYVSTVGDNILGWQAQKEMGVYLNPNSSPQILIQEIREQKEDLVTEFKEVFREELGCLKNYCHKIKLKENAKPVVAKVRKLPIAIQEEVRTELERLCKAGVIEPVEAMEWLPPIVAAKKKDGSVRLCIDLRALNKEVVVDRFPLPNITQMMSMLEGARVFSTLDLTSAYFQIKLHEESQELTAFVTPMGAYKFKRMPFGSRISEAHGEHLERNPGCRMLPGRRAELDFLGHKVTAEGICPKTELQNTIINLAPPKNKDEIKSFMGMLEFYGKFIRNLEGRTYAIRLLLKKETAFNWCQECQREFEDVRNALAEAPSLKSYLPNRATIVTTDTSAKGLGAVLAQVGKDREETIAFASRSLQKSENNYSVIEKEALAVSWALGKFRDFLWGTQFTLRTDHKPLVEVFSKKGLIAISSRIRRWVVGLQEYTFGVEYVPGTRNLAADCLSRLVNEDEANGTRDKAEDEVDDLQMENICAIQRAIGEETWRSALKEDEVLDEVCKRVKGRWKHEDKREGVLQPYWIVKDELSVVDGCLFRGTRLVPPMNVRGNLVGMAHDGHLGITKTKQRLRESYWWPSMDLAIERRIRDGIPCSNSDKVLKQLTHPMVCRPPPSGPWEELALDIVGPLTGEVRTPYILVLMDMYSRWPEVKLDKLWSCGDITLKEAIAMVKKAELARRCADAAKREMAAKPMVNRMEDEEPKGGSRNTDLTNKGPNKWQGKPGTPGRQMKGSKSSCYRCGSWAHEANDKTCPAFRAKCMFCGVMGHYEKVCRKKMARNTVKFVDTDQEDGEGRSQVDEDEVLCIEEQVFSVGTRRTNKPVLDILIGGVMISIVADSGSPYTSVQRAMWTEKFMPHLGPHLEPPDIRPVTYWGNRIPIAGYRPLTFEFRGHSADCKLYVTEKGPSVLGWMDQGDLGMKLDPGEAVQVLLTEPETWPDIEKWKRDFPKVFGGRVGKLEKFSHIIILKMDATPVSHKVRNVPIAVREAVQQELRDLEINGIIEPITCSEWLAPLVVVMKPNGKVRLCVDLCELNKNIVVEKFPLPQYIPGSRNKVADYLSRAAAMELAEEEKEEGEEMVALMEDPEKVISNQEWNDAYQADKSLQEVKGYITGGWPEKRRLSGDMRKYFEVREELSLGDKGVFMWPEVQFTSSVETCHVITFFEGLIAREGYPESIFTDNGVQLVSKEIESFLKKRGNKHKKCSLYHPETNGMVDRFNRVIKETISWAKNAGLNWKEQVLKMVENYRVTPQSSTGQSPFILFKGGPWITMEGLSLEEVQVVLFGSQPALVDFKMNNTTKIVCRPPPKIAEEYIVDVTVIIGNQSLRLLDAFKYDPSLNPVVVSLSRNTSSIAGGEILVIELLRFDSHEDQDIKVTIESTLADIKRQTSNGIEAILPPMPIGLYNISITINGVQVNSTDELLTVEYVGNITSIEPCCGSFKGGTTLTITGVGFSCISSMVTVLLNSGTCDIISSSDEVIQCQTRPLVLPRGSDTTAVLVRVFIGNVHSCHLGYPTHKFYFTYKKENTPVVSSISWKFVSDTVLFYILGSNMINSSLLLDGFSCELQPQGANQTSYFCSLLLDSLEAGSYEISVMHKEYGYADISSAMNTFDLPPLVFSVVPSNGSACGGLTLTISGQFSTSSSNSIKVNLKNNFSCKIQDFNDNTIRCTLQVNQSLCSIRDSQHLNITVIINGIASVCQGNCSFSIREESTPVVDHITHRVHGKITTLSIRGHRLAEVIDELNILVDNTVCNSTFGNQTLFVCHANHLYPGMHHISVTNKRFGQACFSTRSMEIMIVPQVKDFFPKNVSLNGGALLTLIGLALQGQNSTTIFVGNDSICSISHLSYVTIQCTAPPRKMTSALSLEIDGVFYYVGEVNYHQHFTPVFLFALPSTSRLLRIITSRIAEAENMHVFIGDWICANISGNSSTLQCLVPNLPAGDYQVKGYDPSRGWASTNITYTSRLSVSSILNNYGCLGRGVLHLQGTGFSPGNTSVTVCGSHCEIQDSLITPTDVQCVTQHPSDFLGFLCSFTEDVTYSCKGPQNTYIHCDVTVAAGTSSVTKEFSYVHACHGLPCTASFNMTLNAPPSITGLFFRAETIDECQETVLKLKTSFDKTNQSYDKANLLAMENVYLEETIKLAKSIEISGFIEDELDTEVISVIEDEQADKMDIQISLLNTLAVYVAKIDERISNLNSLIRRAQETVDRPQQGCDCSPIVEKLCSLPGIMEKLVADLKEIAKATPISGNGSDTDSGNPSEARQSKTVFNSRLREEEAVNSPRPEENTVQGGGTRGKQSPQVTSRVSSTPLSPIEQEEENPAGKVTRQRKRKGRKKIRRSKQVLNLYPMFNSLRRPGVSGDDEQGNPSDPGITTEAQPINQDCDKRKSLISSSPTVKKPSTVPPGQCLLIEAKEQKNTTISAPPNTHIKQNETDVNHTPSLATRPPGGPILKQEDTVNRVNYQQGALPASENWNFGHVNNERPDTVRNEIPFTGPLIKIAQLPLMDKTEAMPRPNSTVRSGNNLSTLFYPEYKSKGSHDILNRGNILKLIQASGRVDIAVPEAEKVFDSFPSISKEAFCEELSALKSGSPSDPMPIRILKQFTNIIAGPAIDLLNASFTHGIVPPSWKQAIVKALLKKAGLDPADLANYRPISLLPGLNKIAENLKVERDEVLIYNSSCTITMATEAEMECEGPNQPITTKITEIRKNWGQNTKMNISLNFCGRWSENSSWSCGHPPRDGDNVTVERGQTLMLDTSTEVLNLLHVKGGKLLFLGPGPVSLHAHYILVTDGGELRVGSHDEPFPGKAHIHLYGSGHTRALFPYGVKFLAVRNATLSIHGWQPETPFTHLKSPAPANSSRIELEKKVDWRPGDAIVISGHGQDVGDDSRLGEVVTIETVTSAEVVFRPPLRYQHGFVEQMVSGQHIVLKPLVAVLTRDIVLRGNLTSERISYVQQCAAVGITDVSKCIYGKSERRLGSRDLGAVVIVQTFQDEASVVRLEGLQLQDVGQAFRPPPAALTIAGNGHMTDSYIRGCSIHHSFGRGISLSSTSNLKVENNILYNISGHGLLLEEGVEHGNRICRNAVIEIFPTDALSNNEILAPAGILIRAPTNTVEENIVHAAGIGFFFHLSPEGQSQASLQSFSRNTATYCTRSALKVYPEYCPKSTRETAIAVFQSFTAWRCPGGVEIHRSSNLQLQHFQIFSCTDFGIDITESLGNTSLVDSLLLGRFTGKSDSCMVAGLKTPKRFQLWVSNTTFVNFDKPSCTAISTCSGCYHGQGGFRVEVVQLKFINSPNQALFPFPHSAILEDVDGSVSGEEGSHLLASMDTLPASCLRYAISGTSIGSICGKDVILHRMSVGLKTAPELNKGSVESVETIWEAFKVTIRGITIAKSCGILRDIVRTLTKLESELKALEAEMVHNPSPDLAQEFRSKLSSFEEEAAREVKFRGKYWTARRFWEGDRPGKVLAALTRHQRYATHILEITDGKGGTYQDTKRIQDTFLQHYKQLYSTQQEGEVEFGDFLDDIALCWLGDSHRAFLGCPFELDEIRDAIMSLSNGKAAGLDGLPAEFYKCYIDIMAPVLKQIFEESLEAGILPGSMREVAITSLLKPGKDPLDTDSYRPLSLLNSDAKILAKVLATRLSLLMTTLVLPDQSGFVPGRATSHNLRTLFSLIPTIAPELPVAAVFLNATKAMMAPDREYYLSVTDSSNKTTIVNYVHDTLSNKFGWMALLVDTETYTLAFDDPSTRNHLQYSATFDNFAAGNYLLVQHGDLPSRVAVMITCGGQPGQSLQFPPSPSRNKGCDWFFDRRIRKLTYLVSGESDIRITFKAEKRVALPPAGPSLSPNVVLMWSLPESWQGVEPGWGGSNYSVPSEGDDVIILPNRTISVDIELPPLRGLYILGTLEFPANSSNVLSAGCIVVAGGELNIGTSEHPLEREHKVSIFLRASEGISCHRLDGINVDPGTIGVFGKLQIHSVYPKMTWTRLGADIAPGNDRILLEDAVDWTPGEDIVISSSTYDAHQAELETLKVVSKNSIKIHKPLLHRHTGKSYMVENRKLSSAAEVGLLARNVKIETDEPCSGRIHVGQLKNRNGTYFTGVLQLSNVEITNFGTLQHSSIEFNGAAPGSYMMFSSVHRSCSGGISAVASSNILLHGNIVFNTTGHGINLEGQNHNISRNLIVLTKQPENAEEWIAGIKINLADDIALFGNTVAGSERIAFWVSGQICDQFQNPWNENVAHSSLHGVHLYDGDGFPNCTRIVGFTAHKNYDYGIMFHIGSSVLVENVTLFDNNIGLLPIVHKKKDLNKSEKKYIILRHCMILATSPAFDCLKDRISPYNVSSTARDRSPFNPLRGRVGIIWPIFTSKAGQWPNDSWHRIISNSSVYGIAKFQDVTFSGFVKSCSSDDNDVCIMSNPESVQVMFPIIAERTTMSQIKDVNKFFFHTSQPWSGDVCLDACDRRRALFKDVDGSTLPLTSSLTVSPGSEHEWPHSCFHTSKLTTVSITDELDSP